MNQATKAEALALLLSDHGERGPGRFRSATYANAVARARARRAGFDGAEWLSLAELHAAGLTPHPTLSARRAAKAARRAERAERRCRNRQAHWAAQGVTVECP